MSFQGVWVIPGTVYQNARILLNDHHMLPLPFDSRTTQLTRWAVLLATSSPCRCYQDGVHSCIYFVNVQYIFKLQQYYINKRDTDVKLSIYVVGALPWCGRVGGWACRALHPRDVRQDTAGAVRCWGSCGWWFWSLWSLWSHRVSRWWWFGCGSGAIVVVAVVAVVWCGE